MISCEEEQGNREHQQWRFAQSHTLERTQAPQVATVYPLSDNCVYYLVHLAITLRHSRASTASYKYACPRLIAGLDAHYTAESST